MFENLTVQNVLLGIVLLGGAGAAIWKWIAPAFKIANRVTKLEEHDQRDYQEMKDIKESNRLLCRGIVCLMDHAITGNSVDRIKTTKDEIQKYLIDNML